MNRFSGPPTSPPDPGPVSTHDHEWRPDHASPVIEDGAAIFTEDCGWAEVTSSAYSEKHDETFYGTGAECDETRRYRFDVVWAERRRDGQPNIRYLASEFDHFWLVAERALIAVEEGGGKITSIDPDEDYGEVVVADEDWRVRFEP